MKKAFDSINHTFLFYKLAQQGIQGRMYKALAGIYKAPKACDMIMCSNKPTTDRFL